MGSAKSKTKDPNGRYISVYTDLLNSPAYRVLGFAAKALFIDLREQYKGVNNGNLSATLTDLKHKGWSASATLANALYELRAMGFIAVTRQGGLSMGTRVCTLYRFTDLDVYDMSKMGVQPMKATHDYRQFKTVRDAEIALKDGVARLKEEGKKKQSTKKKSPVQKLNRISSKTEPITPFISSETEQGEGLSLQKLNRGIQLEKVTEAA
jgi:hypothetical protein